MSKNKLPRQDENTAADSGAELGQWADPAGFDESENDYSLPVTLSIDDTEEVINIGIHSDIGTRASQQDSSVIGIGNNVSPAYNGKFIAAVCDGMGGLQGGEIASALCAKTFYEDFFKTAENISYPDFFKDEIDKIDFAVSELKTAEGEGMHAGSTFVAVIVDRGLLYWASVGDSHLYIARGSEIVQVNRDHNYYMLLKEKVKAGEMTAEEAEANKHKEALVSYMGMRGVKYMDVNEKPFKLIPEDCIILCSDGLYRLLTDEEILGIVSSYPRNMTEAAKAMVEAANDKLAPHQDNTSVIIFKYI
ncbi:MAG: protein phosphatase 2C domain-containing protein [Clostridiales bacterium]|nr:protein phosphatase 2C domain-containing protein [Clostridiales bacterium]MCD7828021.1 protein phosphatase 2C domain-containing protein [Clostridiales bacterium]